MVPPHTRGFRAAVLALLVIGLLAVGASPATAAPCDPPIASKIACENSKPGTPASQWDVFGAGDPAIQGFATDLSVDQGQTVRFKIDTAASDYRLEIYRMGWYGGDGARLVATVQPTAPLFGSQPACRTDAATGLVDCGNWRESASWTVPADAVSGIYFARVVREDLNSGDSHIVFVVRDDDGRSDLLFQTSDTTWQAYNRYGGNSLYTGANGRAQKVSYNRPFTTRQYAEEDWVFNSEYPMVRWLERNGYDVSYATGIDSHRFGAEIREHKTFLSVGHDEYWSGPQRANVEAARAAGVNLAFFSGNEVFWKTRFENSIDGTNTPNRTLVSYKETHDNAKTDPEPGVWTGSWRDPRFSPPADGGRPENALTGQIFMVNDGATTAIRIPAADGKMRFWRGTSVAQLSPGQQATLPDGTLGYEWDFDPDNGHRPAGAFRVSSTTVPNAPILQDYGSNYASGTGEHHMTIYRHSSGALVFGAGTVQWPWGLDATHDRAGGAADARMQQATVNLFADMRVQPATLQSTLSSQSASTDTNPPTSGITSPAAGASVQVNRAIEIKGSAADGEVGGQVAGVEVSVNGGQTWHPAEGRTDWTYVWTPTQTGPANIRSRAVDDSGNIQATPASVNVDVVTSIPSSCPCSIFDPTARPANPDVNDAEPLEVGVKFRSDEDGFISALRFYKGPGNTGTHVGHLWNASGQRLAEATFTGETASGWQQVNLSTPVPVVRNATYVASYHTSAGVYAVDDDFFANPLDNPPLHGIADGVDGGNGVYHYGASAFPTDSFRSSNYWVDVVFNRQVGPDTTPPQVTAVSPAAGEQKADPAGTVSATFSEPLDATTVNGTTFRLRDASGALVPADVNYDNAGPTAVLTPRSSLAEGATYTATVSGGASGVADRNGNRMAQDRTWSFRVSPPITCPCSLFDPSARPVLPDDTEGQPTELGVKFRSDLAGYITGVRFYKGQTNTGTHVGHLWTRGGRKLAEATFTAETASGWQEVRFGSPVAVNANTTYVASYHSPTGGHSLTETFFAEGFDTPPLHGLADGVDGGNGVFRYGESRFPSQSFASSNYWVDVVFERTAGPDTTPPKVTSNVPVEGAQETAATAKLIAGFDEMLNPATVTNTTMTLRDPAGALVPATVTYDAGEQTATLVPNQRLDYAKIYTATVSGGATGVADRAGNRMAQDFSWSFQTEDAPPPPPTQGPGGPILVVTGAGNPFTTFNAEILRAEGLNQFAVSDLTSVTAASLASYQVVVLGETPLTAAQVTMFTNWVQAGGNLIAMRPDKKLAPLLGLTDASSTLAEGYIGVDTSAKPGTGITGSTIQYHGTADRYTLGTARAVATLYSTATTATSNPAVTLRSVGTSGGQAAAFTYDLARSVVYTRQGNPAWAGTERDGLSPLRSDDFFFGAAAGNVRPDWVDFGKVAIPQADEQQRLLANMVTQMNLDRAPLPRFWYLPRGKQAAVVMTGDDHAHGGTSGQFDRFKADSPAGCSVADWECIRATSYVYPATQIDEQAARGYENAGFEIALHLTTGCGNFDRQELDRYFDTQLEDFTFAWPTLKPPRTNRTHCIAFGDWSTTPRSSLAHGIRLDTNFYYWPDTWVQNRPGLFTGSGMPMRFADTDGSMIDVYQATTQITDESGQDIPSNIATLLGNAQGPQGYYGVITANMHTDSPVHPGANAIVAEAKARNVPVVSARQMLTWLDGRNNSSFKSVNFSGGQLSFTIDRASGARGLQAMVPVNSVGGAISTLTRDGVAVSTTERTIKGMRYLTFDAAPGAYAATYLQDNTPPAISAVAATARPDGSATVSWTTNELSDSKVQYGTSAGSLTSEASDSARVTSHQVQLTGLNPGITYFYRVTSVDAADNSSTSPVAGNPPSTFGAPIALTDNSVTDFGAGTTSGTYVGASGEGTDGEVQLSPAVGEEFEAGGVPASWTVNSWTGGTASVLGGALSVDGSRAGTTATYPAGRTLEFVATLGAAPFRHVGLGVDYNDPPWSMFSTGGGGLSVGLYARTAGAGSSNTAIPGVAPTAAQRYRISWTPTGAQYYVNGTQVASHANAIAAAMRPLASDFQNGDGAVQVQWMRMSPYAPAGTFTSRVHDAGGTADWTTLDPTGGTPSGTQVSFETRSGGTATPDATWSAWQPVATGGDIPSPNARYLQYRANLSTPSTTDTPTLERVRLGYLGVASGPDPNAGLVAALGFDEASGATATDATGRGNNGTITGPLRTDTAKFGRALTFDGVDDFVNVPDSNSLDLTNAMTLEAWVRPTAAGRWRTVLMKQTTNNLAYALYSASGGATTTPPSAWISGSSLGGTAALPLNTWTHIATTYDRTTWRLFVNGTQVASRALTAAIPVSAGALRIGHNSIWTDEPLQGGIDEIRVYNRALTAAEIASDRDRRINP